jgi:hypothetical protein
MTHGLALPDAGGVIIVTSPSLTGAVPGDCADVRYRQWRRHNRNIRASLATSRDIDTTSRDIACRSQFDRWFFNACSTRWIARSGLAGTEHPFSGSQSMMALLRSFALSPFGIFPCQSSLIASAIPRVFGAKQDFG